MSLKNNRVPKKNSKTIIFNETNNNSEKLFKKDNEVRNNKESQFNNLYEKFLSESTNINTEENIINNTSLNLHEAVGKIQEPKQFDDINSEKERNKKNNSKKKCRKLIGIKRKRMKKGKNRNKKVNNNLNNNRFGINSLNFIDNIFSRQLYEDDADTGINDIIATRMQADGTREPFLIHKINYKNQAAYILIPLDENIGAHMFGDNDDANDASNEFENQ